MKISEYIREIGYFESMFDGVSRYAPTGEEYTTLKTVVCMSKKSAELGYKILFTNYLKDCATDKGTLNPTVYWRKRPELRRDGEKYQIYSRLLCSGKQIDVELVDGTKEFIHKMNELQNE